VFEVPVASVQALEMGCLAWLALQRWREVATPGEVMVLPVDRMVAGNAHRMVSKVYREEPLPGPDGTGSEASA
jgi:hypothetical protein